MGSAADVPKARGTLLGAGREAEVYAYGSAVLKLYRSGFGGHRAEAATLRALEGHGIAPKLLDLVDIDGRSGLVVERVTGPDMLTVVQRRPWRVLVVARSLAETHLAIHRVRAPVGLPKLREVLADRISNADLPPHLLAFVMRLLDGLPDGDNVCHGDYHPGNVLLAPGTTAVIDWGAATRGATEADHARTLLLLRWATPLPGTPPLARALIATGRSLLTTEYTRRYRSRAAPSHRIRVWLTVHAAARVGEGISAERDMLVGRLERANRNKPTGSGVHH
jgi:hypothetical protein